MIQLLLEHPSIKVNQSDINSWTPLYVACMYGTEEPTSVLLRDDRVNLNLVDRYNWTPLMASCWNGCYSSAKEVLRDLRADLSIRSSSSYMGIRPELNALEIATATGFKDPQIVELLIKETERRMPGIFYFIIYLIYIFYFYIFILIYIYILSNK